jgi:mRNA interferase RelE/StbE
VIVDFHPHVLKQLQQVPRPVLAAALKAIVALAENPRPPGCVKLVGGRSDWRIRIGDHRVIYEVDDTKNVVTVFSVAHRGEVYR